MIYFICTLICLIISFIINKVYGFKEHKFIKIFISILPLTLLSAFRYDVGWDYFTGYVEGFNYYVLYNKLKFNEPGFMFLIKAIATFTNDYKYLFVFTSLLVSLLFSKCVSKFGKDEYIYSYILLYVLTRYYFCSLNIIRQSISMMIILYSLSFLTEKKYLKYILSILVAASFHKFSMVYLIIFPFLILDLKKKQNIFFLIILCPLIILCCLFYLNKSTYSIYFINMFGNDGSFAVSELLIGLLIFILSLFIYKSKKIEGNKYFYIYFNMEIIVLILAILSPVMPTVDRLIWYFSVQNIFYIPLIINGFNDRKTKLFAKFLIYIFLIIVCINQVIITDSYSILPYKNILNYQ